MNIYVRRSSRRYYTFCRAQPESSDKLAFLDALLPDTNIAGAKVVAERLRGGNCRSGDRHVRPEYSAAGNGIDRGYGDEAFWDR